MAQIHWASAVSADFSTSADWIGGSVPSNFDTAVLDAAGGAYTVTVSQNEIIGGVAIAANATLSIISGGQVFANGNDGPSSNAGTILIGDGASFHLGGSFSNTGLLSLASAGTQTHLQVLGGLILTGGGKVKLSDNPDNFISSDSGSLSTLVNSDNTIAGAGQIGDQTMTIINDHDGSIKASGVNPLVLMSPTFTMINAGTLKATGAGGLVLSEITIDNEGQGVLKAKTGSSITLQSAQIDGGTLATAGTGVIQVSGNAVLDGSDFAVFNTGVFEIAGGSEAAIAGGIDNSGTIELTSSGGASPANMILANNVTLTGGGQVMLSDSDGNLIAGLGAFVLTNVDNTISGAGQLGAGQMVLTNLAAGVIDANGATNSLAIDTGANTITNYGLMEATGSGDLKIDSALANFGVLEANGGTLEIDAPVSGSDPEQNDGHDPILIAAGNLFTGVGFNQDVTFTGTTGVFGMLDSQAYDSSEFNFNGTVRGFSTTGGTTFDLRDIGFVSANEAVFVGGSSGGTLTVSDGTHTAHIELAGADYTGSTFVASSDGAGGVIITDPPKASASATGFAQAMANMAGAGSGSPLAAAHMARGGEPMLMAAHPHLA